MEIAGDQILYEEFNRYALGSTHGKIGLYTAHRERFSKQTEEDLKKVYDFYEEIMRNLFERPMAFDGRKFERGQIIRDSSLNGNVVEYLFGALINSNGRNPDFVRKVLETTPEIAKDSESRKYASTLVGHFYG